MVKEMHPEEGLNIGGYTVILSRERKQLEIWSLNADKEGAHMRVATEKIDPDMRSIECIENAIKTLISIIGITEEYEHY